MYEVVCTMFVAIGSGRTKICETQNELRQFKAIYPYVKWHYCETMEEALNWIRSNQRSVYSRRVTHFGSTEPQGGYIDIEYFIDGKNIYYNLYLKSFGKTRILPDIENSILVDNRESMIKVKVLNTVLNNMVIMHHGIAMQRILRILGEYVDVNFLVPDMSVYIAFTSYNGKDIAIKRIQEFIKTRVGGVSFTVKEYLSQKD